MSLQAGTRLGPYEVGALIGVGGMGEVYAARDTRLDRKVAVKVLAPELATDPEFRARFAQEAKAISSLNHPLICGLFDIGSEQNTEYLVLELLEGETLAARLERGPLPLPQVLRFGIEIADALEAAHRKGIVHRDLKPGNVMLTGGGLKLLDFGLAKHASAAVRALSTLATAPGTGTAPGTIIGTLQYMAPEQVQGFPADARSDLFALGTILYEMATGRRAFEASTQASLIARILTSDVPDVSTLAPVAPPLFDHVVQCCLAKEPADRWQTAHDLKLQLQWIQQHGSQVDRAGAVASRTRRSWSLWIVSAAAVLLAATVLALLLWPSPAVAPLRPMRFDVTAPLNMQLDNFDAVAIAPDAKHLVFTATVDGQRQLVRWDLTSGEQVTMPGTQGGVFPFWSPDSRSVAFFQPNTRSLKKVLVAGGSARVVAENTDLSSMSRGTWASGTIVFGSGRGPLYRVAETGGPATPLDLHLPTAPRKHFAYPVYLPDGRHFTVSIVGDRAVYVASVDSHEVRKILDDASAAVYAAGHLLYARGAGLFARPFDAGHLEFFGPEVQVAGQGGSISMSDDGTIVYRRDLILANEPASVRVSPSRLTWFDRSGRRTGTLGGPAPYQQVVVSARGRHATVVREDDESNADLWDVDLMTGIFTRLTNDSAADMDPSWSPDERALAFTSTRAGSEAVFLKDVISGKESALGRFEEPMVVDQWTPDGRFVIARTLGKAVYAISPDGDQKPRLLADTPYVEDEVHVSPDGQWVAFNSNESGPWEVYVAAFPSFGSKQQLSSGGGTQPQWRADGRELFYIAPGGTMMSIPMDTRGGLRPGGTTRLFTSGIPFESSRPQYGVTGDGHRFLGLEPVEGRQSFTVLVNWLQSKWPSGQAR